MTRIFILAGQSNMVGSGIAEELPEAYRAIPANVRLWHDGDYCGLLDGSKFGPEVGFAKAIGTTYAADQVVLCKVAYSGANLYYDWNPDATCGGPEDQYRGPCYPKLREQLRLLTERLASTDESWELSGMLWMQGERDSVIEVMAKTYEQNLTAFIARVRGDLGCTDLPFIMGRIAPRVFNFDKHDFQHAFREVVQQAQQKVADNDSSVELVETRDLPQGDNLHFNTAGQLILGKRYAAALGAVSPRA